jgi:excinuclease UvrABC ATPase subunit
MTMTANEKKAFMNTLNDLIAYVSTNKTLDDIVNNSQTEIVCKSAKKHVTKMSEFKNDYYIHKGSDACPTCQGCGSIFIYDENKWVDHCETCPDCMGYKTIDGKARFQKKQNTIQWVKSIKQD